MCKSLLTIIAAKIFKQSFWMMKFGGRSPKRTTVWGNSCMVKILDQGRLSARERDAKTVNTCKSWIDGDGRKCYQGTSELKGTQILELV